MSLKGLSFCLELGTSLSFTQKSDIKKSIQQNGGEVLLLLKRGANYFVCTPDLIDRGGYKIDTAKKYGLEIISVERLQEIIQERRAFADDGAAAAGAVEDGAGGALAGGRNYSNSSEESETASIAASEADSEPASAPVVASFSRPLFDKPQHKDNAHATLSTKSVELKVESVSKPEVPRAEEPRQTWVQPAFSSSATNQPQPTKLPIPSPVPLPVPPAPVETELDDLFGAVESDAQTAASSDGASEGGFDSMDSDVWFGQAEDGGVAATTPDEPTGSWDIEPADATVAETSMPSLPPPTETPPEEKVFWDAAKGVGWRRKEVFQRKREIKRLELSLTAYDRHVMQILTLNDMNFPQTIGGVQRNVPTGLPGSSSLEEQFDSKKRSKQFENKTLSVIDPNASWVKVVQNDASIRKKIIPPSYVGQKVFFGGISFEDLEKKMRPEATQKQELEKLFEANRKKGLMSKKKIATKLKKPITVLSEEEFKKQCKTRIELFKKILARFGPTIDIQESWEDGYIFVIYKFKDDAEMAVKTLKSADARKAVVREIKEDLVSKSKDKSLAPRHDFYVRWPEYYVKWMAKRREKAKAEKEKNKPVKSTNKKKKKKKPVAKNAKKNSSAFSAPLGN